MAKTTSTTKTTRTRKKAEAPVEAAVVKAAEATAPVKPEKHAMDDLILVESVCQGELLYQAKKSGVLYTWAGYGDVQSVEYQDLRPLVLTKSEFVNKPWFIVNDESMWAEFPILKEMYVKAKGLENLDSVLLLSNDAFQKVLMEAPEGIRNSIKTLIATKLDEGTFDSIQKLKIVDQILGTDLMCLLNV